jgi:hypothetical protein
MIVELIRTSMDVSQESIKVTIARKNVRESDKSGVDGRSESDSDEDGGERAKLLIERFDCVGCCRNVGRDPLAEVSCVAFVDSGLT